MPQNSKNEDYGKILFSWDFPEFPQHKREASWYFWGAIVVILLLIYSIVTSNFLFAILVVISAATVLLFQRSNNQVEFKITEDGIWLTANFINMKKLKISILFTIHPKLKPCILN